MFLSYVSRFSCVILVLLTGCAYVDEGATDYRKSEIAAGSGVFALGKEFADLPQTGSVPARNLQREMIRLVPLYRKITSSPAPSTTFTELDAITIRLQAAYINFYTEGPFSYIGDAIAEGQILPRGELAVVVNAFQLGEGDADFDFSRKGVDKGRVVYFSQDVKQGQFLNFSNMPVYGPVTYQAKPIGLDFAVLELDLNDQVTVDLLTTLASFGGKAFPAAAPGLDILSSLGNDLVQQQTNDINLRYNLLLDPHEGGHPDLSRTILEAGNYVFIRAQDRSLDIDWTSLLLDENTGKLYVRNFEHPPLLENAVDSDMIGTTQADRQYVVEPYIANNYFTFQINKNESAQAIDLPNYDFGTFLKTLNQEASASRLNFGEILKPVEGLVEKRVQIALFDEIRSSLGTLQREKVAYDLALAKESQSKKASDEIPQNAEASTRLAAERKADVDEKARVRAAGAVLRRFDATWRKFEPTLIGDASASVQGGCPDGTAKPETGTEPPASGQKTVLTNKQCSYVLTKFEEIANVSDSSNLKFFQPGDKTITAADRKLQICTLILAGNYQASELCS